MDRHQVSFLNYSDTWHMWKGTQSWLYFMIMMILNLIIMYIGYHLYCAPDQYYAQKSPSPLRLRSWPRCIEACEWNSTFFWMQETRYDQPGQRGPSDICVIEGARVFQLNAMCFFSVAWTLANCKALDSQFHMVENFQIFELQHGKPWSIRKLLH